VALERGVPHRLTKLVCTIGPASRDRLPELVAAGLDVARLNLSHASPDMHRENAARVRQAAAAAGRSVAILLDFPGPKIRLGPLEGEHVTLETGETFRLRPGRSGEELPTGDSREASMGYEHLAADMHPGDRILLVDGAAELRVTGRDGDVLVTEVVRGGPIRSKGGVNVPSERLSISPLTAADRLLLPLVAQIGADLVAQSFVRTAADIAEMRALLPDGPPIVAKIETRAAVEGIDAILDVVDAIMVARGDLGVEIPFEDVPLVQKDLIARALARGRPVIVATQMLESMTAAPRPTRAEASDVANAVLDGADAVMLSAESAVGAFPIEAASAAVRIAVRAEAYRPRPPLPRPIATTDDDESVVGATAELARGGVDGIEAILCFTRSGRTAELLAARRPGVPILAFTPHEASARRLAVRHGIMPVVTRDPTDTDDLLELVLEGAAECGLLAPGSRVAVAAASRAMLPTPNLLLVTTLPIG
jgi:pyruvate kinase